MKTFDLSNLEELYQLGGSIFFDQSPSKGDTKRFEIIMATIECLSTIGYDKTTYESIAKVIGTRRAHVNYYFKDKKDIFLATIRYIIANYQLVSFKHIESSGKKDSKLLRFIEGPYLWANKYPDQLKVMYIFYYLCSFEDEYRDLHHQIRESGMNRLSEILVEEQGLSTKKAQKLAIIIQNTISGFILTATTTNQLDLEQSEKENKKLVLQLLT